MKLKAICLCLLAPLVCPVALSVNLARAADAAADKPAKGMKRTIERPTITGTLEDALKRCRKLAKVKFLVDWEGIEKTGVKRDAKVEIKASKASVGQLVDITLTQVSRKGKPLAWFRAGDTVYVTTQAVALVYANKVSAPRRATRPRAARTRKTRKTRPAGIRELDFKNTPLSDVIEFLRTISGLNIHVNWRALKSSGIEKETPINIKVKNVSLRQALNLVVDQLSGNSGKFERIYWVVDGNIVRIAPGTVFNVKLRTKVLDVADLIVPIRNFEGRRIDLTAAAGSKNSDGSDDQPGLFEDEDDDKDDKKGQSIAEQRKALADSLIKAIKASIGDDMWRPDGKGSIVLRRDKLIISQTLLGFKLLREASWTR